MALTFCDSFVSYAATSDLAKKWNNPLAPWTWNATAGPGGGPCLAAGAGAVSFSSPPVVWPVASTRVMMGWFMKISAPDNQDILIGFDSSNNVKFRWRLQSSLGWITLIDGSGGQSGQFFNKNIADNQWHWIEFEHNTANGGTQRCFIDGNLEGQNNNYNLTGTICKFNFNSCTTSTMAISNIVCWDNTGSGLVAASMPLGPRAIDVIRPNGDNSVQFTASAGGGNFAQIDEVNGSTTDYVESGTSGQQDLYDYAALGFSPTNINAIMVNSYLVNPIPGTINHQAVCKSGATTSVGTSVLTPSVTPRVVQQPYDLDPNGSIAWTQANLDAAQFGIKVS